MSDSPLPGQPQRRSKLVIVGNVGASLVTFRGPLIRAVIARGIDVVAVAPDLTEDDALQLREMGAKVRDVSLDRTSINPLKDLATFWGLFRILREVRPDYIITYTIKPVVYGSLAAWLCGVPARFAIMTGVAVAFGENDGLKEKIAGIIGRALLKTLLKKNRKIFFQNPDDRSLFIRLGIMTEQQAVLTNGSGVDLEWYSKQPTPDAPVFLLCSRLIRKKGIPEYVEAAARIKKKHPEARFLLVGSPYEGTNPITESELNEWTEFGTIEHFGWCSDVRPFLAQSAVFVLPSRYREGTPRSVLEAMSVGRPIITTDAPGCRETVDEGVNGFLVPVGDVTALTEAMRRFIEEPHLIKRMGEESRRLAEAKYDVHLVNAVILETMGIDENETQPDYISGTEAQSTT